MTNNPVFYTNTSSRVVPDAVYEGPFLLTVSNLMPGGNLVAAEVHQQSATSGDIVFGVSLEALVTPSVLAGGRPVLGHRKGVNPGIYYLWWTNSAFYLESAPALGGPWAKVQGSSNPHTLLATNSARYYRLRQ